MRFKHNRADSIGLEDQKEGMAAFVEKRKANFRNR
jgi:hypothetical protein